MKESSGTPGGEAISALSMRKSSPMLPEVRALGSDTSDRFSGRRAPVRAASRDRNGTAEVTRKKAACAALTVTRSSERRAEAAFIFPTARRRAGGRAIVVDFKADSREMAFPYTVYADSPQKSTDKAKSARRAQIGIANGKEKGGIWSRP